MDKVDPKEPLHGMVVTIGCSCGHQEQTLLTVGESYFIEMILSGQGRIRITCSKCGKTSLAILSFEHEVQKMVIATLIAEGKKISDPRVRSLMSGKTPFTCSGEGFASPN